MNEQLSPGIPQAAEGVLQGPPRGEEDGGQEAAGDHPKGHQERRGHTAGHRPVP